MSWYLLAARRIVHHHFDDIEADIHLGSTIKHYHSVALAILGNHSSLPLNIAFTFLYYLEAQCVHLNDNGITTLSTAERDRILISSLLFALKTDIQNRVPNGMWVSKTKELEIQAILDQSSKVKKAAMGYLKTIQTDFNKEQPIFEQAWRHTEEGFTNLLTLEKLTYDYARINKISFPKPSEYAVATLQAWEMFLYRYIGFLNLSPSQEEMQCIASFYGKKKDIEKQIEQERNSLGSQADQYLKLTQIPYPMSLTTLDQADDSNQQAQIKALFSKLRQLKIGENLVQDMRAVLEQLKTFLGELFPSDQKACEEEVMKPYEILLKDHIRELEKKIQQGENNENSRPREQSGHSKSRISRHKKQFDLFKSPPKNGTFSNKIKIAEKQVFISSIAKDLAPGSPKEKALFLKKQKELEQLQSSSHIDSHRQASLDSRKNSPGS